MPRYHFAVRLLAIGLLLSALMTGGCSDAASGSNANFMGSLRIKLIDAASSYQSVVLTFMRLEIHRKGSAADLDWRVVTQQFGRYDVLQLHNGVHAILVDTDVPVGTYDQVRMIFGPCEVNVSGSTQQVAVPSAIANGFILSYEFTVEEGKLFQLTLDVDPGRSVRSPTPGEYVLNPVFRVQATSLSGSIAGSVVGPDGMAALATISTAVQGDSISTENDTTGNNGSFMLADIPEATYAIQVTPADPAYLDTVIVDVPVIRQTIKSVGAIRLRAR